MTSRAGSGRRPACAGSGSRRGGAPTGLRELGLAEERLEEVVGEVAAAANPVPLDERAARELLKRAWAGERP
jgi:hypothetical protein